ncbi:MAG: YeiH family protein [Paracoccaceae bacterium]|nr:YeiH family protein [Paracoccaceae bacterium]
MRPQTLNAIPRSWAAHPLVPGLGLSFVLALAALGLQRALGVAGLSPLVLAMVGGMALRNLGWVPVAAQPGIQFTLKRILRAAIVLLGFQLTLTQLAAVGGRGVAVIVVTLGATFVFTKAMGRVIGVERRLAELIAAGTSVCGASAVIACNTVTRGSDEDVAYAIACVTVFGSLSMLLFPGLGGMLDLGATRYGLWAGATIHEVAQVVAAAFARGELAGQAGTVAKLSRVMLLAPLILSLGALATRRGSAAGGRAPMPWFAFGFIAVVLLNSVIAFPPEWQARIATGTAFMLTMALAAMGLETDLRRLRHKGLRPLALGALAWVFISALGLGLVQLV